MIYYILASVLVSIVGIFSIASYSHKSNTNQPANGSDTIPGSDTTITAPIDTPKNKLFTKEELLYKLNYLSKSSINSELTSNGAMCYSLVPLSMLAEYICPVCNSKTIYLQSQSGYVSREIPSCRAIVKRLKGIDAVLDESLLCDNCNKDRIEPSLCLIIYYPDKTKNKTCNITREDLIYLEEFLSGSLKHHTITDAELPLKDHIGEIEKMLGISLKEWKK
ncbi:MAG: hypothetical protein V2A54_16885 [Bacteroidota bacterium]